MTFSAGSAGFTKVSEGQGMSASAPASPTQKNAQSTLDTFQASGSTATPEASTRPQCSTVMWFVEDFLARLSATPDEGKGLADPRGDICFEVARIAGARKPPYLLLENVPGLLAHAEGATFAKILASLDEAGYDAEWQVLDGEHWLPQTRSRVYIVGHRRGARTGKVFPLQEGHKTRQDNQAPERKDQPSEGVMPLLSGFTKANGINWRDLGDPMYTLTAGGGACIYDGFRMRQLTPVEYERLMGFPDGWTSGFSDGIRRGMVADAVMVPIIEHIGRLLK